MAAFISNSAYSNPSMTGSSLLSNAPLAPASSPAKKRDADEAEIDASTAQCAPQYGAAPIFKRRMTDMSATGVEDATMQLDGSTSSEMHAFQSLPHHPGSSLNLYGNGNAANVYSGTIAISPSAALSSTTAGTSQNTGFFDNKPTERHILRHLSIPAFSAPNSAAGYSTNGTSSPAFSTFSTADSTSLADSDMPFVFEHDSPDHQDEDEATMHMHFGINGQKQQDAAAYSYDGYNGNGAFWGEDDAMSARYTGNMGDSYTARLEGVMGHA